MSPHVDATINVDLQCVAGRESDGAVAFKDFVLDGARTGNPIFDFCAFDAKRLSGWIDGQAGHAVPTCPCVHLGQPTEGDGEAALFSGGRHSC
jgi:hypothetical protein